MEMLVMWPLYAAFEGPGKVLDRLGVEDEAIAWVGIVLMLPFSVVMILFAYVWGAILFPCMFLYGLLRIITYPFRKK